MRGILVACAAVVLATASLAHGQTTMATNVVDWPMSFDAAAPGLMAADGLLDKPAGKDGPVTVRHGHFYAGSTDKRVRFWGVNICFAGCFPTHEQADQVALRLSRFGINAVRLHHMDHQPFPVGIFADRMLEKLSPEALDRLDYFVAALKKNGVYVDLNLHVSRHWSKAHNWENADKTDSYDKVADVFYPPLIEANKQYARDLLTHVNAYTQTRYADEPAVGIVEINNEDTLFLWGADNYLERMPEPYAGELQKQWNAWLAKKYGTREKLAAAWNVGASPLGASLLKDAPLATLGKAGSAWQVEQHPGTQVQATRAALEGAPAVKLKVEKVSGTSWHVQFKQGGLKLKKGAFYTVRFTGQAEKPQTIDVGVGQAHEPWQNLGLGAQAKLSEKPQPFRYGFTASGDDDDARLSLSIGQAANTITLSQIELCPGGQEGLTAGEDPARGSVARHVRSRPVTPARADDWYDFLQQTDEAYWVGMREFLKKDLGVKAPVTGTIGLGALGTLSQSKMDFVDAHAYWDHPRFPRKPWDSRDWLINNTPMADNPERATLFHLAATRVADKPFTVTEYNHAAPNEYAAECIPMVASYAAAQDWDGLFLFAYSHNGRYQKDKIDSFFDIEGNPLKMAFVPLGARIFLGQMMKPHAQRTVVQLPRAELLRTAERYYYDLYGLMRDRYGFEWQGALLAPRAISFEPVSSQPPSGTMDTTVRWSVSAAAPHVGAYVAWSEKALVYAGTATPQAATLGGPSLATPMAVKLEPGQFTSLMMVSAQPEEPLGQARRVLMALAGKGENPGMKWSEERRSVADQWGRGPARVQVPAVRVEARHWRIRAVKPDGTAGPELAPDTEGFVNLAAQPSLWYEATRRP